MKNVREILANMPLEPYIIGPEESVYTAIEKLSKHDLGALLVVRAQQVIGIISERDYTRKVALNNRSSKATKVAEVMSAELIAISPDRSAEECLQLMQTYNIRHLPVIEGNGQVQGFLSIFDVTKVVLIEKEKEIADFQVYVGQSWPF